MNLFGEKIKQSNLGRIILIIGIAIVWRIILGEISWEGRTNKYAFPVIAFVFLAILSGELTRKIVRLFFKERNVPKNAMKSINEKIESNRDTETLNFSIFWSIVVLIYTVI